MREKSLKGNNDGTFKTFVQTFRRSQRQNAFYVNLFTPFNIAKPQTRKRICSLATPLPPPPSPILVASKSDLGESYNPPPPPFFIGLKLGLQCNSNYNQINHFVISLNSDLRGVQATAKMLNEN